MATLKSRPRRTARRARWRICRSATLLLPWRSLLDNVTLGAEVGGGDRAAARERAVKSAASLRA